VTNEAEKGEERTSAQELKDAIKAVAMDFPELAEEVLRRYLRGKGIDKTGHKDEGEP
jgi:hypothetical protein